MLTDHYNQKVDRSLFGDRSIPFLNMDEVIVSINNQREANSQDKIPDELKKWLMNIGKGFGNHADGSEIDLIEDFNNLRTVIEKHDEVGYMSQSTVNEVNMLVTREREIKVNDNESKELPPLADFKNFAESGHRINFIEARLKEQIDNYATMSGIKFWDNILDIAITIKLNELYADGHIKETIYTYPEYKSLDTIEKITKEEMKLQKEHADKSIKDLMQRKDVLALLRKIILVKNEWIMHGRFADYASDRILAFYTHNIQPRKEELLQLEKKLRAEKELGLLKPHKNTDVYVAALEHIRKARKELRTIEMQVLSSMAARLEAAEQFGHLSYDDLSWAIFYKLPELPGITRPLYTTDVELNLGPSAQKRIRLRAGLTSSIAEGFRQCIEDAAEQANDAMDNIRKKQQQTQPNNGESTPRQHAIWMDALNAKDILKRLNRLNMFRVPNELSFPYKTPAQIEAMPESPRLDYQARSKLYHNNIIRYALNTGPAKLRQFSQDQLHARNNFTFDNITADGKALWLESSVLWLKKSEDEFKLLKESVIDPSEELKKLQTFIQAELDNLSQCFKTLQKTEAKFVLDRCIDEISETLDGTYLRENDIDQLAINKEKAKLFINAGNNNPADTYIPQIDILEVLAGKIVTRLKEDDYSDTFIDNCMKVLDRVHPNRTETGLAPERRKEIFTILKTLKNEYYMYLRSSPIKIAFTFVDRVIFLLRPTGSLPKEQLLYAASKYVNEVKPANWINMLPLEQDTSQFIPEGFQQFYKKKLTKGIKYEFFRNTNRILLIQDITKLSYLIVAALENRLEGKGRYTLEAPIQAIQLLSISIQREIHEVTDILKEKGFDENFEAKKCACLYKYILHKHTFQMQMAWLAKLNSIASIIDQAQIQIVNDALVEKNIKKYLLEEKGLNLEKLNRIAEFIAKSTKGHQLLEKQNLLSKIVREAAVEELKVLLLKIVSKENDVGYSLDRWQVIVNFLLKDESYYHEFLKRLKLPINLLIDSYDGTSTDMLIFMSTILIKAQPNFFKDEFDPITVLCEKRYRYVIENVDERYESADVEYLESHKTSSVIMNVVNAIIYQFIATMRSEKKWNKSTAIFIEMHADDFNVYNYRLLAISALLNLSIDEKAEINKAKAESLIKDVVVQTRPDRSIPPLIPPSEEKPLNELKQLIDDHLNEPWSQLTDVVIHQFGTLEQRQQWNYTWASNSLKMSVNEIQSLDSNHPLTTLKDKLINEQDLVYFYVFYFGIDNLRKLYYQIKEDTFNYMKEVVSPIDLNALEEKKAELEPDTDTIRAGLLHMSIAGSEFYHLFSHAELCKFLEVEPLQEEIIKDRTRVLVSSHNFFVAVKNFYQNLILNRDPEQAREILLSYNKLFTMGLTQRNLLVTQYRETLSDKSQEIKKSGAYDYAYEENPDLFFTHYKNPIIQILLNEVNALTIKFEEALEKNTPIGQYIEILQSWISAGLIKEAVYLPLEWVTLPTYEQIKSHVQILKQNVSVCQIKFKIGEIIYSLINQRNYKIDFNFQTISIDELKNEFEKNPVWQHKLEFLINACRQALITKTRLNYAAENTYFNLEKLRYLINLIGSKEQQLAFAKMVCPKFITDISNSFKKLPPMPINELKSLKTCLSTFVKEDDFFENLGIDLDTHDPEMLSMFGTIFVETTLSYFKTFGDVKQTNELISVLLAVYKERVELGSKKYATLDGVRAIAFTTVKQILKNHNVDETKSEAITKSYLDITEISQHFKQCMHDNENVLPSKLDQFRMSYITIQACKYLYDEAQIISLAISLLLDVVQKMKSLNDPNNNARLDSVIQLFTAIVPTDHVNFSLAQAKKIWSQCAIRAMEPSLDPSIKTAHETVMDELIKRMLRQPIHHENRETVKRMLGKTVTFLAQHPNSSSAFSSSLTLFTPQTSSHTSSQIDYAINRLRAAIIMKEIEKFLLSNCDINKENIISCRQTILQKYNETKGEQTTFANRVNQNSECIGKLFGIKNPNIMRKVYVLLEIYTLTTEGLDSRQINFLDRIQTMVDEAHQDYVTRGDIKTLPVLIECKKFFAKPIMDLCTEWYKSTNKLNIIGALTR